MKKIRRKSFSSQNTFEMVGKTAKKWETQFSLQHQKRGKLMHELIKLTFFIFR